MVNNKIKTNKIVKNVRNNLIIAISLLMIVMSFPFSTLKAQQFSNSGFENWNYLATQPNGWNSLSYMGINLCEENRSTSCHSGSYSVEIKPKMMSSLVAAALQTEPFAIPGLLTNATINMTGLLSLTDLSFDSSSLNALANIFTDGLSISNFPSNVSGYYNFSPINSSDMFVLGALVIGNRNNTRYVVGGGMFTDSIATDGFAPFNITISSFADDSISELIFLAMNYNMDSNATSYGSLKLDDISVTYQSSIDEVRSNDNPIIVYPNPSDENGFYINTKNNQEVSIFNILGQEVKHIYSYNPNTKIMLDKKGFYVVKIGEKIQKLIIR
jgi:hypothetical protein